MIGILALIILNALPGIILSLDLATPETVSFSEERVWSGSYSYLKGDWIMWIISLVCFATIAILSIVRKWSPAVLIGSILLMINSIMGLWLQQSYISAANLEEMRNSFEIASMINPVSIILYLAGNSLIAFSSDISRTVKIMFMTLVGIGCLLSFVYLGQTVSTVWGCVLKPVFAAVIIYVCIASKPAFPVTAR